MKAFIAIVTLFLSFNSQAEWKQVNSKSKHIACKISDGRIGMSVFGHSESFEFESKEELFTLVAWGSSSTGELQYILDKKYFLMSEVGTGKNINDLSKLVERMAFVSRLFLDKSGDYHLDLSLEQDAGRSFGTSIAKVQKNEAYGSVADMKFHYFLTGSNNLEFPLPVRFNGVDYKGELYNLSLVFSCKEQVQL